MHTSRWPKLLSPVLLPSLPFNPPSALPCSSSSSQSSFTLPLFLPLLIPPASSFSPFPLPSSSPSSFLTFLPLPVFHSLFVSLSPFSLAFFSSLLISVPPLSRHLVLSVCWLEIATERDGELLVHRQAVERAHSPPGVHSSSLTEAQTTGLALVPPSPWHVTSLDLDVNFCDLQPCTMAAVHMFLLRLSEFSAVSSAHLLR